MSMVFKPRPGFRFKTSADVVGGRIEQLKSAASGEVTPEAVVEDATPPDSPLHGEFGNLWDDAYCGIVARKQKAQNLIDSYIIVFEQSGGPTHEVLGNVRVVKEIELPDGEVLRQRVYISPPVAMASPQFRDQIYRDADRYLAGAVERLRLLKVAEGLIAKLEAYREELRLHVQPKVKAKRRPARRQPAPV